MINENNVVNTKICFFYIMSVIMIKLLYNYFFNIIYDKIL